MYFESYGPFRLSRDFTNSSRKDFWEQVDRIEGLRNAVGCYTFGLENGDRAKPWYVGKTTAQTGYYGEIFTDHKLRHYDNIIRPNDQEREYRRGTPFIMFFPLVTETWRFSNNRSSSAKYIDWLESTLIGMALSRNPEIANKSKTRFHNEVYVHGIIGDQFQGRPSGDASFAKRLFVSE